MSDDEENEGDILGDLAYVAGNPDSFDKETMVEVIKAAIAEIIDLRTRLAMAGAAHEQ